MDSICGSDFANMQLINKFHFLLGAIDIYSKYTWFFALKNKNGITITNTLQEILDYNCKPKKLWVEKACEFYNRSMKSWLQC